MLSIISVEEQSYTRTVLNQCYSSIIQEHTFIPLGHSLILYSRYVIIEEVVVKIAILSTPNLPTPPFGYGSSELAAGLLAEDLASFGHDVTVFAAAGSQPHGCKVQHFPEARAQNTVEMREAFHVARTLQCRGFDVIHNHCVSGGPPVLSATSLPTLTTLHYLPPAVTAFPQQNYIAISHQQRSRIPEVKVLDVVHYGIDLDTLSFCPDKDDYLLFLGRLHSSKGPHIAIDVAKRLGLRLLLATPPVHPDQKNYFETQIAPNLHGKIEWIGEVGGVAKTQVIGQARALLTPIQWEEHFGLIYIEALACGTPVISFRRGAAPEILQHGKTGFIVDDIEAMIDAVEHLDTLDPVACRRDAEKRFDRRRMAKDYERIYLEVVSSL
jgi:glycosyltransferase involved in cell wall biosynthesis